MLNIEPETGRIILIIYKDDNELFVTLQHISGGMYPFSQFATRQ